MKTYKPIMEPEHPVVKFTKKELETLLTKLKESKAQEIGVELKQVI